MDLIYEYREQLWSGTLLTIRLALVSLAISVTFGLLGAWAKLSGHRLARRLANAYTTLAVSYTHLTLPTNREV